MDVEVRAPRGGEWIRVNPNPASMLEAMLIKDKGETYMVAAHMVERVETLAPDRMERKMLFTVQNRVGEMFLWPVSSPVADDHLAYQAMEEWICYPVLQ